MSTTVEVDSELPTERGTDSIDTFLGFRSETAKSQFDVSYDVRFGTARNCEIVIKRRLCRKCTGFG